MQRAITSGSVIRVQTRARSAATVNEPATSIGHPRIEREASEIEAERLVNRECHSLYCLPGFFNQAAGVAQIKKEAVRSAILDAAAVLFARKGYIDATIPQIAALARVSPSTVYVYFRSKLEIVYVIYTPWFRSRLEALDRDLDAVVEPRARLKLIVSTVWQDLPTAENGFAINLMQALASATLDSGYDPGLLHWAEATLAGMLMRVLPEPTMSRARALMTAHIIFMGFDGFALNARTNPASSCSDALVEVFVDMLSPAAPSASPAPAKNRKRSRQDAAVTANNER
jgi:AcrR family transcriptional regulator